MDTVRPKRPFAITVRALLLAVLVVGLVLGWKVNRAHRQRDAVAAIEDEGGKIVYDWEMSDAPGTMPNFGPNVPDWIRHLAGDDLFQRVDLASVDAVLSSHLRDLPGLRTLVIGGSMTEEVLVDIGRVTSLRRLELLGDREMTDSRLDKLAGLTSLSELAIEGMAVSDATLFRLVAFRDLELLYFDGGPCHFSDPGLGRLGALPKLRLLYIGGCPDVTDEGISRLKAANPTLEVYREGREVR
jgi:hypothetical protein